MDKILVYGYGNPGRQDDGLGNELVKDLEGWAKNARIDNIHFDSNYQLNIEDAEMISNFDLVFFIDASVEELDQAVVVTKLDGSNEIAFTSHAASPGYIVHLCAKLFEKVPESYLLHIKGYEWGFQEGISDKATEHLNEATILMKGLLSRYKEGANIIQ